MANTTNYALTKPTVGGDADVWGGYLNTNWDDADALFSAIATTGSANAYVLTTGLSLAAYATGQKFTIIPNFTNSGAATINVDAIGAKNIYKNSAGTKGAVASGDIVSGVPIDIVYDGTQFVTNLSHAAQPLDATLTALAALSWSSGSPVVQFTAADTVSLTLTPALTSMTLGGSNVMTRASNDTITGKKTFGSGKCFIGDANFFGYLSGNNARWYFDNNSDFLEYDRGSNFFGFRIANTRYAKIDAGGISSAYHLPLADNAGTVGAIALRFVDIFAVSGSVNTSDAREKTPLEETPETLRRIVRRIFQRCGLYRWKFKGDDAPWSYGITAQIVEEEFAAEGLDAHDYHLFEESDLPDNEDQPTRKCLRPDQLFYLGISTLMMES